MDTDDRLARVAVFVGVVVIVALVVGLAATLAGPSGPRDTAVAYPNASDMVPNVIEASDETVGEGAVGDDPRVVLIDNSHANRFEEDDLRPFLDALGDRHEVMYSTDNRGDLDASLAEADAYVVIDPGFPHTDEEVDQVGSFVESGGRLVVLGEPTRIGVSAGPFGGVTDIRSRVSQLGSEFGIHFGADYLYDDVNNEGNYKRILADGRGDLDGDRMALYTATTVNAPGGTPLLVTPETTRLSAQSEARGHTVAVRSGDVLAVGDSTFLSGGKSVVADNERFVRVIAEFAVGGERTRDLGTYPYFLPENPRVRYTSSELLNASKAVGSDLRASGRSPTISNTGDSFSPDRTDVLVATFDDLEASNAPETGVRVTAVSVSVPGYDGPRDGVAIVHRPEGPIGLVVAASSPERAMAVVGSLGDGTIGEDALSETTAVTVVTSADGESAGAGGSTDAGTDESTDGTGETVEGDPADRPTGPAVDPSVG